MTANAHIEGTERNPLKIGIRTRGSNYDNVAILYVKNLYLILTS